MFVIGLCITYVHSNVVPVPTVHVVISCANKAKRQ